MKQDYLKYYHPSVLIVLIIVFAMCIIFAKDYWGLSISVVSIVTALLILISTYLWKFKPFIWMFWVDDFSGRYEGVLKYKYISVNGNLETGVLKHVKLINQNGNRITISSFTIKDNGEKSSLSVSKGMHVEKTEDEQHFRLIYNYLNGGSVEQGFSPHYGTDELKFIKGDNKKLLVGNYYTNRTPQTRGELELNWVNHNLNHEF